MIVPSSSEINYSTELSYLEIVPNEVFIESTTGNLQNPAKAIKTLCDLKLVCSDLKKKVDLCWGTFILLTGRIPFYIPIYAGKFNINDAKISEKSLEAIKIQFPKLKKWELLDFNKWDKVEPTTGTSAIMGRSRQCILNDHLGHPELWVMLGTNAQLEHIDLKTNAAQYIDLKKQANPISRMCHPFMARSNHWIAICSRIGDIEREINVIHLSSDKELNGSTCHTISGLGEILELHCENDFLYVLCRDAEKSKFLRYDSKDWTSAPMEFGFSDDSAIRFYIGSHEIVFTSVCNENQFELSAINKDTWFLGTEADLRKASPQINNPILKTVDDVFFTMTSAPKSTLTHPVALLEILDLDGSAITKKCLLKLPVNAHDIEDFHIVFDKIFILQETNWKHSISCFDLKNGGLLKEFPVPMSGIGTNFRPTLVIQPPHIKLYFSQKSYYNPWACESTGVLDLNFEIDLDILQETVEK